MKINMNILQTITVFCFVVMSTADDEYENKLTKLWSLSSASNSDGSAVVNVTSASIVIQPSSYSTDQYVPSRISRDSKLPNEYKRYAFKPRAIPLRSNEQQVERNVYYSQDDVKSRYKKDVLFPGNYAPIAKEKSSVNVTQENYNPMSGGPFHPKSIPLIRSLESQKRSLDVDEEPIIEKPEGFSETAASRRSLSYILGVDDDEEEEEEEDDIAEEDREYEIESADGHKEIRKGGIKKKKPKLKPKKLKKYMLPLLLAYKMKYFALVPVMIGGLVLLVGATGLAGFFFALFAAVMGLQKGGY